MNKQTLDEIQLELNRFQKVLKEAQNRSKENKGYIASYDNKLHYVGEISGTKEAGSLRRSSQDLKRLLTKLL
jgi:hypothetical protein